MPQRNITPVFSLFQYQVIMLFPLILSLMLQFQHSMASSISTATATNPYYLNCSRSLRCGQSLFKITYPFLLPESPSYCGVPGYELSCNEADSTLTINLHGKDHKVTDINKAGFLTVVDVDFLGSLCPRNFTNTTINSTLFDFADDDLNLTVYVGCVNPLNGFSEILCLGGPNSNSYSYYKLHKGPVSFLLDTLELCELTAVVTVNQEAAAILNGISFGEALQKGFDLTWTAGKEWCKGCLDAGGLCGYNSKNASEPTCFCANNTGNCRYGTSMIETAEGNSHNGIIIGLGTAGALSFALLCSLCVLLYCRWRRRRNSVSKLPDRSTSSVMSSKSDPELSSILHPSIFSYDELYIATNGFDASQELGEGGFGSVYKGELKDGRVVAVKRLYENNYRRLEQFMNEVKILSLLRHPNLVSLYGCTSRRSRELLLVYEFVPNGTIADHLHGPLSSETILPWHTRMRIAIETADALHYLHSTDPPIIHRDVKTTNILLDKGFHVKVADFGLSRLVPADATHVSTAPQGTPGYVDPEYHRCFQLTDRSDVYSFGVVLMELISSKPAVDVSRERNEVMLANMAMNKIHNRELHELVDPRLGYHSDCRINGMITQVAALALRCLQQEREIRPGILEVLETLKEIERGGRNNEGHVRIVGTEEEEEEKEERRLLKRIPPYSPNSVTDAWVSTSSTMSSFRE